MLELITGIMIVIFLGLVSCILLNRITPEELETMGIYLEEPDP